ncbi:hypothetical protein [Lysinibacillus sp. K60]|uniref:hypothetical protein n=1 Tax=Lysinibacillus sp. K60 TaxID=2720027 RepID=UPI001C8BBBB8|nr:hypothetical protein [Lysinibacillus sp. K60]MBX8945618.1 hypothetical protein [Lysinibacillus sp. K60]
MDPFKDFEITEEKVRKLLPIVERIWSRKYGVDFRLKYLTVNNITVWRDEAKIPIDIKKKTIEIE